MEADHQRAPDGESERLVRRLSHERHHAERTARELSEEALNQWQKALEGALAFPAAVALGTAACTMYMTSFVARSLEILRVSARIIRKDLEREVRAESERGAEEAKQRRDREGRHHNQHGEAARA